MTRMWLVPVGLAAFFACTPAGPEGVCTQLCRELYQNCEYGSFPSFQSCEEGCAYDTEEGADMDLQYDCILEAECNSFAIVECANAYGPSAN